MMLASLKVTVTLIVLSFAAAYLSFPANETVMTAVPSLIAVILPFSTLTTFALLDL